MNSIWRTRCVYYLYRRQKHDVVRARRQFFMIVWTLPVAHVLVHGGRLKYTIIDRAHIHTNSRYRLRENNMPFIFMHCTDRPPRYARLSSVHIFFRLTGGHSRNLTPSFMTLRPNNESVYAALVFSSTMTEDCSIIVGVIGCRRVIVIVESFFTSVKELVTHVYPGR